MERRLEQKRREAMKTVRVRAREKGRQGKGTRTGQE